MTPAMLERELTLFTKWVDEGDGYYSLTGVGFVRVAYVAIPRTHPDNGCDYDRLQDPGPDVNGGLTFSEGNVFGWDYGHFWDLEDMRVMDIGGDIERALKYFRKREDIVTRTVRAGRKLLGRVK